MANDADSESVQFRPNCSGAAGVEITDDSGTFRLWMRLKDVERNIVEFGRHPGLVAALRHRVEIREGVPFENS